MCDENTVTDNEIFLTEKNGHCHGAVSGKLACRCGI